MLNFPQKKIGSSLDQHSAAAAGQHRTAQNGPETAPNRTAAAGQHRTAHSAAPPTSTEQFGDIPTEKYFKNASIKRSEDEVFGEEDVVGSVPFLESSDDDEPAHVGLLVKPGKRGKGRKKKVMENELAKKTRETGGAPTVGKGKASTAKERRTGPKKKAEPKPTGASKGGREAPAAKKAARPKRKEIDHYSFDDYNAPD